MRVHFLPVVLGLAALLPAMAEPPPGAKPAKDNARTAGRLADLWRDLADADAAKAYQAIWALTRTPDEAVGFIGSQLKPAAVPDARQVARLLEDLNSKTFAVREKAQQELIKLGGLAEPALKQLLKADAPLETRQRAEKLLERLRGPLTHPEHLRAIRAVETLEYIGSAAAKQLLARYAAGAPDARLTQEAQAALARLRRAAPPAATPPAARTDLYGDALPPGAVGRLGTVRFRRQEPVFRDGGLAFLPDGKGLVTCSEEHGFQIWDYPGGRLRHDLSTRPLYLRGFALAPDGKHVAVAGFYPPVGNMAGPSEIRVMELPGGNVVRTLARARGDGFQLAFSPDNKLLFSLGSRDGVLSVDEIASGKQLAQRVFPRDVGDALAVSGDGAYVAVASGPNTRKLFLWKWREEEPREIAVPAHRVDRISFSPDGKLLVGVENFGSSLFGWEVPSGRLVYRQDASDEEFSFGGRPAFTPDGKALAVLLSARRGLFRSKVQFFDPLTGHCRETLETGAVGGGLTFAPDGRIMALTAACTLRFWDMASRQEVTLTGEGHASGASSIIVSPKGFVVTTGDDGSVRLWDAATAKQRWKAKAENWVRALALSPDGSLVAASSLDDAVYVWDSAAGRLRYRLAGHGALGGRRALGFSADGRHLASWGDDFYLRLWDMKTGKALAEHAIRPKGINFPEDDDARRERKEFELAFTAAAFTPDARIFVIDIGGNFHLFDTTTGKETSLFPSEGRSRDALAVSPDGKRLVASSYGDYRVGTHAVAVIDLTSGVTLQRLVLPGSAAGAVAFAADGRSFATSVEGPRGEVLVHELASGKVRATVRGFRGRVRALAFFPDGRRLASGQSDSTVLFWDLAAPEHARKGP
jgi:WD40 repeat protein